MFLGLLDPDPALDPDHSINKQKMKENLNFYRFCDLKNDVNVPSKRNAS
jgi:hypothetical protein